jgi:AcrR family transcriptional regulator
MTDRPALVPTGRDASPAAEIDGRRERTTKTRQAIVDAVIALQEEGVARASAAQIAERAGLSARSIFVHFPNQEALTLAVMDEIGRRHLGDVVTRTPPGSFEERLGRFVARRAALLDRLSAYRRSAAMLTSPSGDVLERRKSVRLLLRDEVQAIFAPELRALPRKEAALVLNALGVACESEAWDTLRHAYALDEAEARRVLAATMRRLLGQRLP